MMIPTTGKTCQSTGPTGKTIAVQQIGDIAIMRVRDAVLAALDEALMEWLPMGATDADLPELFRALDAHTMRALARKDALLPYTWQRVEG